MTGTPTVPFLDLAAVHLDLRDDLDVAWKIPCSADRRQSSVDRIKEAKASTA